MPLLRSQIIRQALQNDVPKDWTVNTVYHRNDSAGGLLPVDYQNHANQLRDLFAGKNTTSGSTFVDYATGLVTVKVYDMTDTEPRPVRATANNLTGLSYATTLGPRLLACCLSFYGTRNLPRQRGRIYVGPYTPSASERPSSNQINRALDLGHGLFDIGGANVTHVVWSQTGQAQHDVTDYWVNDVWDVHRSRNPKESTRSRLHP